MCSIIYNISKAIIDRIYDFIFEKTDRYDNKLFPANKVKKPFDFKYDNSEIFWCEWWTAFVYGDKDNKVHGMVNYIFIKTLNQIGSCIVYPAFIVDGKRYNSYDSYNLNTFNIDKDGLSIGPNNKIIKISNKEYRFIGETPDGLIKWDFVQTNIKYSPINVAQKLRVKMDTKINLPIYEEISFVSILPLCKSNGTITFDNNKFDIDVSGEFEHLWGRVALPTINWNYVLGSDENNNMMHWLHSPAISTSEEKGCIYLVLDKKTIVIRDYDVVEDKSKYEYPDRIFIKPFYKDMTINVEVISLSASNEGSASECHCLIEIEYNKKKYNLYGNSEYYRSFISNS